MKKRLLLAGALLPFLATGSAEASVKWFTNLCHVGSLRTCASVRVATNNIAGNTQVVVWVANLQGYLANDNSLGSRITRFALTAPPAIGTASGLSVAAIGGATEVNGASGAWGFTNTGLGGSIEVSMKAAGVANNAVDGAIEGCDPASVITSRKFVTCGAGQFVAFAFTTTGTWTADQAEIGVFFDAIVNAPPSEVECRSDTPSTCTTFTATPEPVTMLLLGTGLLGVGGAGLRRRRRLNGDVMNS